MRQWPTMVALGIACAAAGVGGPGGDVGLHVPLARYQPFVCPPVARPGVVVVGGGVWDLPTGRPRGPHLDGAPDRPPDAAVSGDGSTYAAASSAGWREPWRVTVWSTTTGRPIATLAVGSKDRQPRVMAFGGPSAKELAKWLIVVGRDDRPDRSNAQRVERADVWDLAAGKVHHSFAVAEPSSATAAISPDGRYLAVAGLDHVHLYEVRSGHESSPMRDPVDAPAVPAAARQPGVAAARAGGRLPAARPAVGHRFDGYGSAVGLAFSPSGREVAGLFDGTVRRQPDRLVIWDTSGHVTFDSGRRAVAGDIIRGGSTAERRNVQWSPDGTRLLLGDVWLVDRKSGMALWCSAAAAPAEDRSAVFLDDAHLLAARGDALEAWGIPTDAIRASVAALANPATPAGLRPGQPVSLSVDLVGPLRGDGGQTKADVTQAITDALTAGGRPVADGCPASIHVAFTEQAGDTLKVFEVPGIVPIGGRDTGRKATAAKCAITVELRTAGSGGPVWSQHLDAVSPMSLSGPVDDGTLRAAAVGDACRQLRRMLVPTFVPTDPALTPLPIVTD